MKASLPAFQHVCQITGRKTPVRIVSYELPSGKQAAPGHIQGLAQWRILKLNKQYPAVNSHMISYTTVNKVLI